MNACDEYVLTGAIERLEEVDDGRNVQAVVELSAQLVDTRTQNTVWRHSELSSEPVIKRDVAGVVSSLSVATRRAIDRCTDHLPRSRDGLGDEALTKVAQAPPGRPG
ncbi:MAG: hypothetical protein ABIX28_20975 [Vicinamibacterales bacterium]